RLPAAALLHNVRSLYNVGAFFRTADAVGLQHLYLSGFTGSPPSREISKTALGAENTVSWSRVGEIDTELANLKVQGWEIAAIETVEDAIDLFDWAPAFPTIVVFGHEVEGLPPDLVKNCDVRIRIPMIGSKQSLNVATAGGVVLYDLLRKYL